MTFSCSYKSGKFEIVSELASKERLFYYQLALIWQAVLTPLLQSGNTTNCDILLTIRQLFFIYNLASVIGENFNTYFQACLLITLETMKWNTPGFVIS